jgi:hypothetical protein
MDNSTFLVVVLHSVVVLPSVVVIQCSRYPVKIYDVLIEQPLYGAG